MSDIMDLDKTLKIKVIGVGGAGNNAISRMIDDNVRGVTFYMINTETGTLKRSRTSNILQIGVQTTRGLGAGANPDIGAQSAEESKAEVAEIKANMQKLSDNIDYIKEHTTKNEDFIRVMTRLENKIDQLRSD